MEIGHNGDRIDSTEYGEDGKWQVKSIRG